MEYTMNCHVRYSECDGDGIVPIYQILNYFQDCATFQSEEIGFGIESNAKSGRAWFLLAYDLTIVHPVRMFERIKVITEPYKMKGHYGYRRFRICDAKDRLLVCADSIWILMDVHSLLPIKIPDDLSRAFVPEDYTGKIKIRRKIRPGDHWEKVMEIPVTDSYLDTNNHVNNNWYARWAQGLFSKTGTERVRIDYRKAAVKGDCVKVYLQEDKGKNTIKYENQAGELLAYIEWQKGQL